MVSFLARDPERTPLLRPRPGARSASCGPTRDALASCDVFGTILMVRQDVIRHIDTPVSWQGLTEPALAFNLVRPLTDKYISLQNLSIIYCLLSNRLQFIHDSTNLPNARLSTTRAALCELLAIRVMTHYAKPTEPGEAAHMSGVFGHSLSRSPSTGLGPSSSLGANKYGKNLSRHNSDQPLSLPPLALPSSSYRHPFKSQRDPPRAASDESSPSARQRRLSSSARSAAVSGARQRRMSMAEPPTARMSKRRSDELVLANVLIAGFHPFAGAPPEVEEEEEMEGRRGGGRACNALELAIVTNSKRFIACVACQKVLESVWSGRIYYTPSAFFDIVPDRRYKQKAITIYDCRRAPTLDHYRLRVPRYRMMLEMASFGVVFALMIVVSNQKVVNYATWWEIAMMVYTVGWTLDRFATTLEHGLRIYAANLWNGIDAAIIFVFLLYLPIRLHGLITDSPEMNDLGLSILSCESALLFPRLAFTLMKRNVLVMSLRAMLVQFGTLMLAAVWIFVGFWHALYTLDEGNYTVWEIAEYMVSIWFGLDNTGFDLSPRFHPQLGPIIFFIFACLANTLFLTVVVAILSHTFAELNSDAKAEYMFRHAVAIVEGVKADALFSYQPPLNLVALVTLGPASWCLSPRAFHRTHVFCTRLFNAPLLLLITLFERTRHTLSLRPALAETLRRALPARMQHVSLFMEGAHGDVYAVFDYAVDNVEEGRERGEDARWVEEGDGEGEGEGEGDEVDGRNGGGGLGQGGGGGDEEAVEDEEDDEDENGDHGPHSDRKNITISPTSIAPSQSGAIPNPHVLHTHREHVKKHGPSKSVSIGHLATLPLPLPLPPSQAGRSYTDPNANRMGMGTSIGHTSALSLSMSHNAHRLGMAPVHNPHTSGHSQAIHAQQGHGLGHGYGRGQGQGPGKGQGHVSSGAYTSGEILASSPENQFGRVGNLSGLRQMRGNVVPGPVGFGAGEVRRASYPLVRTGAGVDGGGGDDDGGAPHVIDENADRGRGRERTRLSDLPLPEDIRGVGGEDEDEDKEVQTPRSDGRGGGFTPMASVPEPAAAAASASARPGAGRSATTPALGLDSGTGVGAGTRTGAGAGSRTGTGATMAGKGEQGNEERPPVWARDLGRMLKRLEERQERLEEMLMPSEGD